MELQFEHAAQLGIGNNPAAVHVNDNSVYLFGVTDGRLMAREWKPPVAGDVPWDEPDFGEASNPVKDTGVSLYRMKNVPRTGVFGAWRKAPVMDGVTVVIQGKLRMFIWDTAWDAAEENPFEAPQNGGSGE